MALTGGGPGAALALDGKAAADFLLGSASSSPENLYLFFDKEFLQTARVGRWKIHVARWNVQRYQAGSGNQINQTLKAPELYDMTVDVGESYNVAANHPEIVKSLMTASREAEHVPEEIRKANADLLK